MRNSEIQNKIKEYQYQNDLQSGFKQRVIPESDLYQTEDKVGKIQESILLAKIRTNNVQRLTSNFALTNTSNLLNNTFEQFYNNSGVLYNQSNISHSINQSIPYFNQTNNYSYPYQQNEAYDYISQINNLNKSNYTNSSNIGQSQQKIYQFIEQCDEKNNIIYNQTYPLNNTNITNQYSYNSSNSTYKTNNTNYTNYQTTQQKDTQQNNSTYYNNSSYYNSSYQNTSSYSNHSNNYNNQTQYDYQTLNNNTTQYSNQTRYDRIRNKLDQININLKLRDKINFVKQINNFTQNITFFNYKANSYQSIVLFNNSDVVQKQHPNDYYYYNDSTLITLHQCTDYQGNVYYRSLDYNFNLTVIQNGKYDYTSNSIQYFGTLSYEQGSMYLDFNHEQYTVNSTQSQNGYWNQSTQIKNNIDVGYLIDPYLENNAYIHKQSSQTFNSSQQNDTYHNQQQYSKFTDDSIGVDGYNDTFEKRIDYEKDHYENIQGNKSEEYINGETNVQTKDVFNKQQSRNYWAGKEYMDGEEDTYKGKDLSDDYEYQHTNQAQNGNLTIIDEQQAIFKEKYYESIDQQPDDSIYSQNHSQIFYNSNNQISNSQYIQNGSQLTNLTDYSTFQSTGNQVQIQNHYKKNDTLNGKTTSLAEQENIMEQTDGKDQTISINGTKSTFNTTNNQLGQQPHNFTSQYDTKSISTTYSNEKGQLNQLRGSKKQISGGWKQVSINEMMNSNSQIIEQAIQAVDNKFNPQQEGYNFNQILSIQEQIVSGINYNIKLKYDNIDNSNIYEVIIYSIPWANQPNQITKCIKLEQEAI